MSLGPNKTTHDAHGAYAAADAIRVDVLLGSTPTTVLLAHARARINDGVVVGLFNGSSYGSKVEALDGTVRSDMTPFTIMPCQGTNGVTRGKSVAAVDPTGIVLQGLKAYEAADQSSTRAWAWEEGSVASLNLDAGTLVVEGWPDGPTSTG